MKIAIISDIHGNLPALREACNDIDAWAPDLVLVNGDTVNRGPRPAECMDTIIQRGWQSTMGNHEEYVMLIDKHGMPDVRVEAALTKHTLWTLDKIGDQLNWLRGLPDIITRCGPGGDELRVTHGSMFGNRSGMYPNDTLQKLRDDITPAPDLFATAHTHRPFTRRVGDTLIVNSGSVGLPFDGDSHLSYARLCRHRGQWSATIARLSYDRAETERDFRTSGYLANGGPLAALVLREFQLSRPIIYDWYRHYYQAVVEDVISLPASISKTLEQYGG